ncbi:glycosyltransferase family 4 protein [Sulfurovum sp. XGS-02]|uniref:glycosyltransferase family 4 protein n=1 Tax=Sulfurovum sp. XGS-02 TaxID=2925411 RepID=UPI00204CB5CB|nr:glycosyltransferase family 4 protein [Sulfurovum sp. XGS-02]UPT77644.1 glycosyltransferase family 4 protein [Sulfurovum sp. XGS-02]
MKNKHITIINQYIGSPYHGMEYRHYYLAKNLIEYGYKVTLISGSYSHLFSSPPEMTQSFTREMIDGIEYIWVKVPKYISSKSIGRIWNMLYFTWKLHFLKDVVPSHIIVSSPSLFPVKVGAKFAKKFHTKFLFEVRDIWPQTLVELSSLSSSHPLIKFMEHYERFAYKKADKVISLLPMAKEHFEKQGMQKDKFVYLPNGIDTEEIKSVFLPQSIIEKIPRDKFIVAYSGTVGIANNLEYLVDAANALRDNKDIHFIILGQGGEKQRLQDLVNHLGLENITFLDPIKKEAVASFLKQIDVAFISLLPENLFRFGVSPNKVFEYMYAKKPILWAIEAGNNLVKEAECGVSVPLNDVIALKESILRLKEFGEDTLNELGQNGYNFVNIHHSYKMLAEKLINVIEEY